MFYTETYLVPGIPVAGSSLVYCTSPRQIEAKFLPCQGRKVAVYSCFLSGRVHPSWSTVANPDPENKLVLQYAPRSRIVWLRRAHKNIPTLSEIHIYPFDRVAETP